MKPIRPINPLIEECLYFDDGSFLKYTHCQNCCETNYADWSSLDDTGFYEQDFDQIILTAWDGGFSINGYAVNCYSSQNGYYSTDLSIDYYSKLGEQIETIEINCNLDLC